MKIGMQLDYTGGFEAATETVVRYEKAGLDTVWVAEAYGFDAPSFMGYLARATETVEIASGIMPIYSRTPTLMAMTAAGIDALSAGRCVLGLGASGPQVIEGWHGVEYDAPVERTREVIKICRQVRRREGRVRHDGRYYRLPLPSDRGTGLAKPLKLITRPLRDRIPIHVAALGSRNVAMTAELADGWLPIFFIPEKVDDVWGSDLRAGFERRSSDLGQLEIAAGGLVSITDDPTPVLDLARSMVALYVGGMGARDRNFYNRLMSRYGYEAEAAKIQDLYLSGHRAEAAAAVPTEFLELTNLVGSEGWIRDRIAAMAGAGVTCLNIIPVADDPLELLERVRTMVP